MIDVWFDLVRPEYSDFQIEKYFTGSTLFLANNTREEIESIAENFVLTKNIILLPIFDQKKQHFFLIVVDTIKRDFILYDSCVIQKVDREWIKKNIYDEFYQIFEVFCRAYNRSHEGGLNFPLKINKRFFPNCFKQKGSDDCGIYLIIHAEHYMNYKKINLSVKLNIKEKRNEIQKHILRSSENMRKICLICGEKYDEFGQSIRCSFCHRWMHADEVRVNIEEYASIKFKCPICTANEL